MLASADDKTKLGYLLSREAKQKFSDNHLWFSVFSRPVSSSFTRLERLTCCFTLLCISMLMNIMFYDLKESTSSSSAVKLGSYLSFSAEQLQIGLITSVLIFVPSLFLVELFRRTKRKSYRNEVIKILLPKGQQSGQRKSKNKKSLRATLSGFKLPWWFKFVAYAIAYVFSLVSLFFVIIKGLEFGDEKVSEWLSSLLVSFVGSVFLTQPLVVSFDLI